MTGRKRFRDLRAAMSPERQARIARQVADLGAAATPARFMIDPPNGHAYGFPKLFEGEIETLDLNTWLRENGYPETEIALFSSEVPCRIITLLDA